MLTTQNVLILILCISDLLLITFNMPLTLIEVLRFYWHTSFLGMVRAQHDGSISLKLRVQETMCLLKGSIQTACVTFSSFSVLLIAYDRYRYCGGKP